MATIDEPHNLFWNIRREDLADFRERIKQEYASLEETSRLLRQESKWLVEESRYLRRKRKVVTSEP